VQALTALFGPSDAIERPHALREAGADGVFTFEGPHDVFTPLTPAATVGGLDLMTNVVIAFPRNPIHRAVSTSTGIRDRVAGVADRICLYQPKPIDVDWPAQFVDALRR
jgi:hypothetical protein